MADDKVPLLFYFMVLDGEAPCKWNPFNSKTIEKIDEDIHELKSVHPTLQKPIQLRLLCEKFDKIAKGPYARTIGCIVDSKELGSTRYKAFKTKYMEFLGKTIKSNNAFREVQGFRLIIVQTKQLPSEDQSIDETEFDDDALDDLAQATKFNLTLSGRGFTFDFARDERRFRQIASAVHAEIRSNESLSKLLAAEDS